MLFASAAHAKPPLGFDNAWTIVTAEDARGYLITLPDEVLARIPAKQYADLHVVDADGKPMSAELLNVTTQIGVRAEALNCRARLDESSTGAHYRCTAYRPVESAVGLRLELSCRTCASVGPVRISAGSEVVADDPEPADAAPNARYAPPRRAIAFAQPFSGTTIDVDFPESSPEIFKAELITLPVEVPDLRWKAAIAPERVNAEGRQLVYRSDFGLGISVVRLRFPQPPDPSWTANVSVCGTVDCKDSTATRALDILAVGAEAESRPIPLAEHLEFKHALELTRSTPLDAGIAVEIGSRPPRLRFSATGVPPYSLLAGSSAATPMSLRQGIQTALTADLPSVPSATLQDYAPARQWISPQRWGRLVGPLLIVLGLAAGFLWALRRPYRRT